MQLTGKSVSSDVTNGCSKMAANCLVETIGILSRASAIAPDMRTKQKTKWDKLNFAHEADVALA